MIQHDTFALLVRDALVHFHSPVHLQIQRLVEVWPWHDQPQDTRAQALRELVVDALESLQPDVSVTSGRTERFAYDVLRLRYIECLTPDQVGEELGIGHTSYYRYHRDAFDALVSLLWERYQRELSSEAAEELDSAGGSSLARQEALRVARVSGSRVARIDEVVQDAYGTVRPLLEQRGTSLSCDVPQDIPTVHIDPVVLRQIILNALVEALNLSRSNTLRLSAGVVGERVTLRVAELDESKIRACGVQHLTGITVSQGLLAAYGGDLTLARDETGALSFCLSIPCRKSKTILIIDDDADTVGLYRRYLQAEAYTVHSADSGVNTWALLNEITPDLVLLDVLMPREDGWDILRGLRETPRTVHVPVVICSVLDQADLALALGAAEVLQKPISQSTLLRTVANLLVEEA
jgi:CheY-like chemotaxis protein